MSSTTVTFEYEPRPLFVDFHNRTQRFALMVVHRRGGKTVACVADLVLKALYTKKTNARFAYIAPYRQQGKEIAWQYLKDMTDDLRDGQPRESELRVKLHNGAWITIYGADNPDAMRGIYLDGCILDEYGDMKPSLMGEVILPTLTDRKGWLAIIGTSKGRNQFFKAHRTAEESDEWYHKMARASETGLLSEADLKEIAGQMTEAEYAQEFECSFDAAVKGTYYADLMNASQSEGRVHDTPLYDPGQQVCVAADIGYSDTCAWWFWQRRPDGFALIDYYQASGKTLKHYLQVLRQRSYEIEVIWLPHDAKARTLQTGRSTIEQLYRPHSLLPDLYAPEARLPVRIVPKLAVQHGIDAVRQVLPMCHFDRTTTFEGLEALRSYRRRWHEHTQSFGEQPLHDWAADAADAFRYFALVADKSKGQSAKYHVDGQKKMTPAIETPKLTLDGLYKERETLSVGRPRRI